MALAPLEPLSSFAVVSPLVACKVCPNFLGLLFFGGHLKILFFCNFIYHHFCDMQISKEICSRLARYVPIPKTAYKISKLLIVAEWPVS